MTAPSLAESGFALTGTHQATLIRAALHTTGPILEYGAGYFSTPILWEIARAQGRPHITVEHHENWAAFASTYPHEVLNGDYVASEKVRERYPRWGLVFIDHDDTRRGLEVQWYRTRADVVVWHDAVDEGNEVYQGYTYVAIDRRMTPPTAVLSMEPIPWATFT